MGIFTEKTMLTKLGNGFAYYKSSCKNPTTLLKNCYKGINLMLQDNYIKVLKYSFDCFFVSFLRKQCSPAIRLFQLAS